MDGKEITASIVFSWDEENDELETKLVTSPVPLDELPENIKMNEYPTVFCAGQVLKCFAAEIKKLEENK